MTKILTTRSVVAQLYVELTSDNLKETFIVEGDEVVEETPAAPVETESVPASDDTVPVVPATDGGDGVASADVAPTETPAATE